MEELYNPNTIQELFDKMSKSYERVNSITSFGFSRRWRKQCVAAAKISAGATVADLMTGMGECWKSILQNNSPNGDLIALDFSKGMLTYAMNRKKQLADRNIKVLHENVFDNSIESSSVDAIISGFGLKTFSTEQLIQFAQEVKRILKPNGTFSFIEVSVPPNPVLRGLYMFYLRRLIPFLGWLLLGNPETYRMLGIYTRRFQNSAQARKVFSDAGFETEMKSYFYGCATGIIGKKLAIP